MGEMNEESEINITRMHGITNERGIGLIRTYSIIHSPSVFIQLSSFVLVCFIFLFLEW